MSNIGNTTPLNLNVGEFWQKDFGKGLLDSLLEPSNSRSYSITPPVSLETLGTTIDSYLTVSSDLQSASESSIINSQVPEALSAHVLNYYGPGHLPGDLIREGVTGDNPLSDLSNQQRVAVGELLGGDSDTLELRTNRIEDAFKAISNSSVINEAVKQDLILEGFVLTAFYSSLADSASNPGNAGMFNRRVADAIGLDDLNRDNIDEQISTFVSHFENQINQGVTELAPLLDSAGISTGRQSALQAIGIVESTYDLVDSPSSLNASVDPVTPDKTSNILRNEFSKPNNGLQDGPVIRNQGSTPLAISLADLALAENSPTLQKMAQSAGHGIKTMGASADGHCVPNNLNKVINPTFGQEQGFKVWNGSNGTVNGSVPDLMADAVFSGAMVGVDGSLPPMMFTDSSTGNSMTLKG